MLDGGDEACVMEVSSHALALGRSEGISYDVRAFTNLTQDHLDFHSDMEDYFAAKRMLFEVREDAGASSRGTAVINADDEYGRRLIDELRDHGSALVTFSASGDAADFRAEDVEFDAGSTRFRCLAPDGEARVEMPLPGHFNVENALAALASASALGSESRPARRRCWGPSASRVASSRSTRGSRSRCSSTTRTPRLARERPARGAQGHGGARDLRVRVRGRPRPRSVR